jgi:hypothetical protein
MRFERILTSANILVGTTLFSTIVLLAMRAFHVSGVLEVRNVRVYLCRGHGTPGVHLEPSSTDCPLIKLSSLSHCRTQTHSLRQLLAQLADSSRAAAALRSIKQVLDSSINTCLTWCAAALVVWWNVANIILLCIIHAFSDHLNCFM